MRAVVALLAPVLWPLLALKRTPPRLPEGTTLVRALKPAPAWLFYQYLRVIFRYLTGPVVLVLVWRGQSSVFGIESQVSAIFKSLEVVIVVGLVVGFFTMLIVTRVDFELRDYLLGDRSLRIVFGVFRRQEITLSYANIQNVEVTQGPIEQLLGIKNLKLTNAVSGRGEERQGAVLQGVTDAENLRELLLRLKTEQQDAGLGDALPENLLQSVAEAARHLAQVAEARP